MTQVNPGTNSHISAIFKKWIPLDPTPKSNFLSKERASLRTDDIFSGSNIRSYNILPVVTFFCKSESKAEFLGGVTGVCMKPQETPTE